jgi:hypothetical protein
VRQSRIAERYNTPTEYSINPFLTAIYKPCQGTTAVVPQTLTLTTALAAEGLFTAIPTHAPQSKRTYSAPKTPTNFGHHLRDIAIDPTPRKSYSSSARNCRKFRTMFQYGTPAKTSRNPLAPPPAYLLSEASEAA